MQILKVIEGWRNHLLPPIKIKELIEETSIYRMSICEECPFHSKHLNKNIHAYCQVCGCSLLPKTKCLSCKCPKDKWEALLTEEEDEKLNGQENANI